MGNILLEIPAVFKDAARFLGLLFSLAQSAREAALRVEGFDYADLERAFADGTAALEAALHAPVLSAMAMDDPHLMIGNVLHRRVVLAQATFQTRTGVVPVQRWLYRPAGDPQARCVDPVALRVGAVRGTWLPGAAESMAFLMQQSPGREAEATARQLQVLPYSDSSFRRVALDLGERYLNHMDAVEPALLGLYRVPAAATGVTVSLDRVSIRLVEPRKKPRGKPRKGAPQKPKACVWRMAYCATITLHDANGRGLHTICYGAMPSSDREGLVRALLADVKALLRHRNDLLIGVTCDGAHEMWNLLDPAFDPEKLQRAVRKLVDLWHLLGYVGKALRVRYDEPRAAQELQRWKLRLLNQSKAAERLLAELESWSQSTRSTEVDGEPPVTKAITFLRNQVEAGRADYAGARRAGQPVGSGHVEASCKSVVNVRFKRCGASWCEENAERLINLRSLVLSDRWESAMRLLRAEARIAVRRAA